MTDVQTAVSTSIVVDAPIDRAFAVFTEDMGSWWPPEHHIIQAPLARMVLEPKEGGRIYDVGTDGSECQWSRVLVYDPPHHFAFSPGRSRRQFTLEPDRSKASEVHVRFTAQDGGRTNVDIEHRHLDRHGEGWEGLREAVGSDGGWKVGLRAFAQRLAEEEVAQGA